jgi:hypothetical protein
MPPRTSIQFNGMQRPGMQRSSMLRRSLVGLFIGTWATLDVFLLHLGQDNIEVVAISRLIEPASGGARICITRHLITTGTNSYRSRRPGRFIHSRTSTGYEVRGRGLSPAAPLWLVPPLPLGLLRRCFASRPPGFAALAGASAFGV